jgi:uncharacterized protein
MSTAPAVLTALADGATDAELRETHLSWVLLAGDRAYKVKKPVAFAFVDQRSLARRRELCEAEVALNAELAPGVYRAVHAIVPAAGGFQLAPADDPAAVDYAIEMRRFDEHATLAAQARRGTVDHEGVRAVARRLADFHRTAPRVDGPASAAEVTAALQRRFDRNLAELLALLPDARDRRVVHDQARCAAAFRAGRAELLAARAAAGRVRDCHGDLRAEHVLPGPPPLIVDRLEFSRELREIDVADELAFLTMDLAALDQAGAARTLLAAYREAGGDPGDDALVAFFAIYRAHVRAKVALLRDRQAGDGPHASGGDDGGAAPFADPPPAAHAEARALLQVAERFAWRVRLPSILVVCGPAASGKSTLARELARRSGRPVIASDVVRKRLAGLPPTARADDDRYTAEASLDTYAELAREAAAAPDGAIVDATFRRRADRDAFASALAEQNPDHEPPVFAECLVPDEILRERATERLRDPDRISDATPDLALAQRAEFEPLDEVPPDRHHPLRADRPPHEIADALAAARDAELASGRP